MKGFSELFQALDETTRTSAKVAALAAYFTTAPAPDRVWTIAILSHRRPRRAANTTELRLWAAQAADIPDWLFEECYSVTGDLAETIARLLPEPATPAPDSRSLADWMAHLIALHGQPGPTRRAAIVAAWAALGPTERLIFNKLITGGFRMGVSQGLMTRALAQATGRDAADLAHALMGAWDPATTAFDDLIAGGSDGAQPYPFCLAHPLDAPPRHAGPGQ
jgi:DNA ligase-1